MLVASALLLLVSLSPSNAAGTDCYPSYDVLKNHWKRDVDFSLLYKTVPNNEHAVIAIHGGTIEIRTGDLALAVSRRLQCSHFVFNAIRLQLSKDTHCVQKARKYATNAFHITSTNFTEEICLNMVKNHTKVLSLHGLAGDKMEVYVGGQNIRNCEVMAGALQDSRSASFNYTVYNCIPFKASNPNICRNHSEVIATNSDNIVNRGNGGVQLEMTYALRTALSNDTMFQAFAKAIAAGLSKFA